MKKSVTLLATAAIVLMTSGAFAAEGVKPPKQEWSHKGIGATYDRASLQRGFQIYKEVCSACHSMRYLSYRDLAGLGYTPDEIKAVAAEYNVTDGPNDDGEMFERPARPSDRFKSPFANEKQARAANGGAFPPDLSLVVKARPHGEDYIYALLNGYETPPEGEEVLAGMHWNKYFPGHQLAMAPPLNEGQVTFADGTAATVPQMAHDVTTFLAFASEPHLEQRQRIGIKVSLFMLAFAVVMFLTKRKVWKDLH